MKILGMSKIFRYEQKFWVRAKILGSGKNFRFGRFWVRAKILGSGENFVFGRKFWVRVKKFCLGEKFGILGLGENFSFEFAFCISRPKNQWPSLLHIGLDQKKNFQKKAILWRANY